MGSGTRLLRWRVDGDTGSETRRAAGSHAHHPRRSRSLLAMWHTLRQPRRRVRCLRRLTPRPLSTPWRSSGMTGLCPGRGTGSTGLTSHPRTRSRSSTKADSKDPSSWLAGVPRRTCASPGSSPGEAHRGVRGAAGLSDIPQALVRRRMCLRSGCCSGWISAAARHVRLTGNHYGYMMVAWQRSPSASRTRCGLVSRRSRRPTSGP